MVARKLAGLSSRPKLHQPGKADLSFREATLLAQDDGYDHLETSELCSSVNVTTATEQQPGQDTNPEEAPKSETSRVDSPLNPHFPCW